MFSSSLTSGSGDLPRLLAVSLFSVSREPCCILRGEREGAVDGTFLLWGEQLTLGASEHSWRPAGLAWPGPEVKEIFREFSRSYF